MVKSDLKKRKSVSEKEGLSAKGATPLRLAPEARLIVQVYHYLTLRQLVRLKHGDCLTNLRGIIIIGGEPCSKVTVCIAASIMCWS